LSRRFRRSQRGRGHRASPPRLEVRCRPRFCGSSRSTSRFSRLGTHSSQDLTALEASLRDGRRSSGCLLPVPKVEESRLPLPPRAKPPLVPRSARSSFARAIPPRQRRQGRSPRCPCQGCRPAKGAAPAKGASNSSFSPKTARSLRIRLFLCGDGWMSTRDITATLGEAMVAPRSPAPFIGPCASPSPGFATPRPRPMSHLLRRRRRSRSREFSSTCCKARARGACALGRDEAITLCGTTLVDSCILDNHFRGSKRLRFLE
jgi:hypothetical protein